MAFSLKALISDIHWTVSSCYL